MVVGQAVLGSLFFFGEVDGWFFFLLRNVTVAKAKADGLEGFRFQGPGD